MAIEFGLSPDTRWTFSPAQLATAAAAAGLAAVGIGPAIDVTGSAAALADLGVRCHELFVLVASNDERRTLSEAERLAAKAASIGAEWVPVIAFDDFALSDQAVALLAKCAAIFDAAGTGLAYEFSAVGAARSIDEALAIVEATGSARTGIIIDAWHFFYGPSTWRQLERVPLERIAHVQFTDGLELGSDDLMIETWNRRAWPGEGVLDLHRFAGTLLDRGWQGLVSIEVLNAEYAKLPIAEFAQRAYESTAPYWT